MPLYAANIENFPSPLATESNYFVRKPHPNGVWTDTLAMHWDGTYRDRVRLAKGEFWTEEDYKSGDRPWGARRLAKHLAE